MIGTLIHHDVDFLKIARHTEGYTGADLELLCREAAMFGIRELMQNEEQLRIGTDSIRPVSHEDFVQALQTIVPSTKSTIGPICASTVTGDTAPCFEGGRRQRKRSAECRSGQQTPQFNQEISSSNIKNLATH
jgi:hypothetical protein